MKKIFLFTLSLIACLFSQAQWEPDVSVTNDPYNSLTSFRKCVAASGDTVHIVWFDNRYGVYSVLYKRSLDAGLNWEEEIELTRGQYAASNASIKVSGSTVAVVWIDFRDELRSSEIYYKRSIDGGSNWGEDTRISSFPGSSFQPSIAISGSNMNIVWHQDFEGSWEICYNRSTDWGATWEEGTRLTYEPALSGLASVAVTGSFIHVVWNEYRDGTTEVYYKRSIDNGISWSEDTRLTYSYIEARDAEIIISGSVLHLVWRDNRDGNKEIYYKHSSDGGITWGEDQRLTNDAAESDRPSMIVSDSNVHVVWHDLRNGPYQIYYKCSLDGGNTWTEDTRLTQTIFDELNPSVDLSGNWLHVLWTDSRQGNPDIYCKNKYIESAPIGIQDDLSENPGQRVSIFPNPAKRQLTVDSQQSSVVGRKSAVRLSILDLYGHAIKEIGDVPSFPYKVDISDLPDGVYFLRIMDESGKSGLVKFVKISD